MNQNIKNGCAVSVDFIKNKESALERLSNNNYQVLIEELGCCEQVIDLLQSNLKSNLCIVTNETIAKLYLADLKKHIQDIELGKNCKYKIIDIILPDGEEYKNQDSLTQIWNTLLINNFPREATSIIALGGGVITDIAGFAASTYLRGVGFISIPTTLLAQVDAAVGGKTAINHILGKNMLGAFYQPKMVICDVNFFKTLPDREFNGAVSEVIKYGLIWDADFFDWLVEHKSLIHQKDEGVIKYLVRRCVQIKVDIISKDPLEKLGLRCFLNLGHTFAHALEGITEYKVFSHGEAVGIGVLLALQYSANNLVDILGESDCNLEVDLNFDIDKAKLSLLKLYSQTKDFLEYFNCPTSMDLDLDLDILLKYMSRDKKNTDHNIKLILLYKCGSCLLKSVLKADLKSFLQQARLPDYII